MEPIVLQPPSQSYAQPTDPTAPDIQIPFNQGQPQGQQLNAALGATTPQAPTSPTKTGLRAVLSGMLQRFSYGAGQAMKKDAGLPTDQEMAEQNARLSYMNAQAKMMERQSQMVPYDMGNGHVAYIPQSKVPDLIKAAMSNKAKTYAAQITANPKYLKEGYRLNPQTNEVEKIPDSELSPIQKQNLALSRSTQLLNDAKAQLELAKNNPNSPLYKQAMQKIMDARALQLENLGLKRDALAIKQQMQADGLTNTTKSMVEAAPKVKQLIDRVNQEINQQVNQLGPAVSRWNEFMAGKVGAPNTQFIQLRTNVGLLTTLLMRMHVGARGGEYIMKHFEGLMNYGTQSPENLRAALAEVRKYADDVEDEGRSSRMNVGGTPAPKPGGRRVVDLTK